MYRRQNDVVCVLGNGDMIRFLNTYQLYMYYSKSSIYWTSDLPSRTEWITPDNKEEKEEEMEKKSADGRI